MVRLLPIGLLLHVLLLGCARFRIEELKPTRFSELPIARADSPNLEQYPQVKMAGHVPYDLPIQPITNGSRVYMSDPERRLVRVFDLSGEVTRLIGPPGVRVPDDVKFVRVGAGIPGLIAVDEDRTLYIQYRKAEPLRATAKSLNPKTPGAKAQAGKDGAPEPEEGPSIPLTEGENTNPVERIAGVFDTRDRGLPPSVIVQINRDDKVVQTIGKEGVGGAPFGLIYSMDVDPKNRLIVTYREGDAYRIGIYEKGVRLNVYENLTVKTPDPAYDVRVEGAAAGPTGEFALFCAVYRDRKTHNPVLRKVFRLESPEAEPKEIYTTDDVRDFCGPARADGGFYMLNAEKDGSRILFKIFSPTGEYLDNRLIRFPGMYASWRRTFMRLDGRIFSSRIYRGKLEMYEWK